MNRNSIFIKKRNKDILKKLSDAMDSIDALDEVADIIIVVNEFLSRVIKKYIPDDAKLKELVHDEVFSSISSMQTLDNQISLLIQKIIDDKIYELGDNYKRELRQEIKDQLDGIEHD